VGAGSRQPERYLATVMLGDVNVNDWLVENKLAEKKRIDSRHFDKKFVHL
jgi:endonuclease YncB( thermonuclease family)